MSEPAMMMERRPETEALGEPQTFEKLRELVRNGYVPDPEPGAGGGMLLRHDAAPDLILHADGRIELPVGQRPRPVAAAPAPAPEARRMSKRRTLLIIVLAAAFWLFSMFLTASILSS